ncbi:MAG: GNAT family N-acetyltransferase [Candidatus Paracaedibacteraceae bacterium]|nr:GNAT family N-acetyltransferase [Candidatus Paracaedibacteraceae bacterium]
MIPLSPHHAKVLHEIHAASVDPAWSEDSFSSLLALPTVFGFAAENLSCFILYSIVAEDAEILTIATHPDYRRQGFARQLMINSFDTLNKQGIKTLFLEVDVSNKPAITLYEKLNFQVYGHRPNYYKNSLGFLSDAQLMQKKI